MMMNKGKLMVYPLRSGSSGNSVFISDGKTRILIDAGTPCSVIEEALLDMDQNPSFLDALLVTHEHSDHIAGVGVLMRRYHVPLFVNSMTWQFMQRSIGPVDLSLVHPILREQSFSVGRFDVKSFATPHDAVASVGYRIETCAGAITLMTDIGEMSPDLIEEAAGSRIVMIEANYDPAMLLAGPYPSQLKQRVSSPVGHLSNEDCARAVYALLGSGTEQFILSHLSKENNYPELALLTVGRYLNNMKVKVGDDIKISVARRFAASDPICL